jgi:hypothetical protein
MATLLESLAAIRDTPLDEIVVADAEAIVAEVLRQDEDDEVDVARFGSII